MGENDQVVATGEPSAEEAAALTGTETTQGQEGASSTETPTPEPSADQQQVDVAALQARAEKAETDLAEAQKFGREQQGHRHVLEQQFAPVLEQQRQQREQMFKDDEWFNKRAEQVGTVAAIRELNQVQHDINREQQAFVDQQAQASAAWTKVTDQTDAYAKEAGLSQDDMDLLRAHHQGFGAPSPEASLKYAKLAIDKEKTMRDAPGNNANILKTAEQTVREKVAGSPPGVSGGAAAPQEKSGELKQDFISSVQRGALADGDRADLL